MFGQNKEPSTGLFGGTGQTTGTTSGGFQFGPTKPAAGQTPGQSAFKFGSPAQPTYSAAGGLFSGGVSVGAGPSTAATAGAFSGVQLGGAGTSTGVATTPSGGFAFGGLKSSTSGGLGFGATAAPATSSSLSSTPSTGFMVGGGTAPTSFGLGGMTATASQPGFGGASATSKASGLTFAGSSTTAPNAFSMGGIPSAAPIVGSTVGSSSTGFSLGGGLKLGGSTGSTSTPFAFGTTAASSSGGLTHGGTSSTASSGSNLGGLAGASTGGLNLGGLAGASTEGSILGGLAGASTGGSILGGLAGASRGGLNLSGLAGASTGGSNLGGLAGASTGGLKLGVTTASGPTLVTSSAPSGTAVPGLGGFAKIPAHASTTASQGLTLGGLPASTTGIGIGLTATKRGPSFGTTSTTTTSSTVSSSGFGVNTLTSTASTVPKLTYKQLEEQINKWANELEDYESTFLDQASQVNAWDRTLMENGNKITELNSNVEGVKAEQKRLDQELDFITAQQRDLEDMLTSLEEGLKNTNLGGGQLQHADKEREFTYGLAKDIDGQLKQMVQDLKSIIDHLNSANSQQSSGDDPIVQIAKILNAHMNSLQWIDQNSAMLQRKVDDVARLSEIRRKEQERNFRLAFD